jgi:hypothetical protein
MNLVFGSITQVTGGIQLAETGHLFRRSNLTRLWRIGDRLRP